jgi:hypothetical protein
VYSFIRAELRPFWATYSGYGKEDGLKGCRVALIMTAPRSLIAINT